MNDAKTEAVRSRAFLRAAETQVTKVIDALEPADLKHHLASGVVPEGVYLVDEPIVIERSVVFELGCVIRWKVNTGPAFVVEKPDLKLTWLPGSSVVADGWIDLEAEEPWRNQPGVLVQAVVLVWNKAHRTHIKGLTVSGNGDYGCGIAVYNADDGLIEDINLERYNLGIRLANRSIKGWTLRNIKGDYISQTYNVRGGPTHLIYALSCDQIKMHNIYEGPNCLNNRLGEQEYGSNKTLTPGRSGHTIKAKHPYEDFVEGLEITGLVSRNPNGPLILGGAITAPYVRGKWFPDAEPIYRPSSKPFKRGEPHVLPGGEKLIPVDHDVVIQGVNAEGHQAK